MMTRAVKLNGTEIAELNRQNPTTEGDGGFQGLLVSLQGRLDLNTGELILTCEDLEKIPRYAYDYKSGGWQDRLERIFLRELGPRLGR